MQLPDENYKMKNQLVSIYYFIILFLSRRQLTKDEEIPETATVKEKKDWYKNEDI